MRSLVGAVGCLSRSLTALTRRSSITSFTTHSLSPSSWVRDSVRFKMTSVEVSSGEAQQAELNDASLHAVNESELRSVSETAARLRDYVEVVKVPDLLFFVSCTAHLSSFF
uniref:Phosphoenolpyruvate carboxykinase (GTP) n=1 Tax=Parascaris univalens TaxID=6257 RepID=A0A915BLL9_PARUN